jgi:hypothetical protein
MTTAPRVGWVVPLIAAALSGTAGAGSVYAVATDYNEAISELRVAVALCKAADKTTDREIERLWKQLDEERK